MKEKFHHQESGLDKKLKEEASMEEENTWYERNFKFLFGMFDFSEKNV